MGKRRITDDGVKYRCTPLLSITETQVAALHELRSALPPSLESLSPLLESILASCGEVVPPHRRTITVSIWPQR